MVVLRPQIILQQPFEAVITRLSLNELFYKLVHLVLNEKANPRAFVIYFTIIRNANVNWLNQRASQITAR